MSIFPGAISSFAGFTSSHTLSADNHASQHNSEQAEIIAAQTKIGTGSSTPANNLVLRGNGAGTSAWGQVALTTDVSGILPVGSGGLGQNSLTAVPLVSPAITGTVSGGATYTTPILTSPVIADFTSATHNHQNNDGGAQLAGQNAIIHHSMTYDRLLYGSVYSRRGGSATDWSTTGTTDFDTSDTDTKVVLVATDVNANPTTVGFGVTFSQIPQVFAVTWGAVSNNVYTIVLTVTTSQCTLRQLNDAGTIVTTEKAFLLVIGKA